MHSRRGELEGDASASAPTAADGASGCPLEQDAGPAEDSFPAPRSGSSGSCSGPCHRQSCCPKCSARPLSSSVSRAGMWGPGLSGNLAAVALSVLNSVCPWRLLNEVPSLPMLGFHCPSCSEMQPGEAPPCFSPPHLSAWALLPASLAGCSHQPPYSLPFLPSPSPPSPTAATKSKWATYFLSTLAPSPSSPFPPALLSQDPCWPHFPPASPVF